MKNRVHSVNRIVNQNFPTVSKICQQVDSGYFLEIIRKTGVFSLDPAFSRHCSVKLVNKCKNILHYSGKHSSRRMKKAINLVGEVCVEMQKYNLSIQRPCEYALYS